jgi:hypothetical protein
MVDITWKSFLKTHKVHTNEGQNKDLKKCSLGTMFFEKQKKSISKGLLKIKSNLTYQKSITII